MQTPRKQTGKGGSTVAPYLDLGFRFALSIAITTYAGYWLDSKLNTLPLFLIIGLILGATSGFFTIYRAVYTGKEKESKKGE